MSALPVHDLPLFLAAALLLNVTPGPDMLFVAGSAAAHGRRAGVMAALGVGVGCLLHMVLAAAGLSALLATSALAFEVVKWAGAAYLVWIGIGMLRGAGARRDGPAGPGEAPGDARAAAASSTATAAAGAAAPAGAARADPVASASPAPTARRVFWQGALTNALNPKVALFFLAFLPQFITPGVPQQALALFALGALFDAGGTAVNVAVAWAAGSLRGVLMRDDSAVKAERAARWTRGAAGALFIGLGLKLGFGTRP